MLTTSEHHRTTALSPRPQARRRGDVREDPRGGGGSGRPAGAVEPIRPSSVVAVWWTRRRHLVLRESLAAVTRPCVFKARSGALRAHDLAPIPKSFLLPQAAEVSEPADIVAATEDGENTHTRETEMSISGDSWHKVSSETPEDNTNERDPVPPQQQQQQPQRQQPRLIISDSNVEEGSAGALLRLRGGLTLLFVVAVWVIGALAPLVACALIWVGSRTAYTVLAGLFAAGVFPYVAKGSGSKENGDVGWTEFRHAIPRWSQYWHKSCGRVYEKEGPESWDNMPPTVFCYHPHGVFTQGYIINGSMNEELPKILGLLATALYHAPLFRLVFGRWAGSCAPSSKQVFLDQMKKGLSFGIIPGGFQEATLSKLGEDHVWMKNRKGLVKYALQSGYRLRPCFTFGESDTYWNAQGMWKLRLWMAAKNLPGVCPWGTWWCPLLPRRVKLMTVFGEPLALPKIEQPSPEDVDKWHAAYVEELKALHGRHKAKYASNPQLELKVL